ncbi:unnamed protein product [Vicia faba]|uniref:Uncharacterized protein n=1 Tax=Vicia faba TaxID=3906 RepID=A0AAV1AL16_VICFA|nr:unnamed protein product [Vicia faba]
MNLKEVSHSVMYSVRDFFPSFFLVNCYMNGLLIVFWNLEILQVSFLLSWDSLTGEFGKWLGEILFQADYLDYDEGLKHEGHEMLVHEDLRI